MKEYIRIVTKEGPIEQTVDLGSLLGKRVISARGIVVGRVKKVRLNKKLHVEGVVVSSGFGKPIYLGSSYFDRVSDEAVILSIDPFLMLKGMRVVTNEGEVVGKVKEFVRHNDSNEVTGLIVKSLFRKDTTIDSDYIKSIGSSIILKSNYNVTKKYFWQKS